LELNRVRMVGALGGGERKWGPLVGSPRLAVLVVIHTVSKEREKETTTRYWQLVAGGGDSHYIASVAIVFKACSYNDTSKDAYVEASLSAVRTGIWHDMRGIWPT
jgi:hypothetical protein